MKRESCIAKGIRPSMLAAAISAALVSTGSGSVHAQQAQQESVEEVADGIHTTGDATLENVHWWDVGEDALTIKEEGTVSLDCGSAFKGSDKIFQINAPSTFKLSNFTANGAGKLIRQVGGSTWKMTATIDHCDISDMSESVFRTDSSSSHVTFTNSRYHNIDDALFIFGSSEVNGNSSQSTVSNLQAY